MNRAKSIFIGIFPALGVAIIGYSVWQIRLSSDVLTWLGPLLTVVPFLLVLSWVMIFRTVARTSQRFPLIMLTALAGVALGAYASFVRTAPANIMPFALAASGAAMFVVYSFWYSSLDRTASEVLKVGNKLPALSFKALDGSVFRTEDLLGDLAVVLFFRGNWCPLCMAQIKEVAARYRELSELGAKVLLVSPQPQGHTQALAKRFDVPFLFLRDEGHAAARTLGIEMKNGLPMGMGVLGYESETVLPTVIVLDKEGIVRWCDETDNYRVRPEPDTFLPLLRELAA